MSSAEPARSMAEQFAGEQLVVETRRHRRGLTLLDVLGLNELIKQNEYARSSSHNLAVVRGTDAIQRVLKLTGVEDLLDRRASSPLLTTSKKGPTMPSGQERRKHVRSAQKPGTVSHHAQRRVSRRVHQIMARSRSTDQQARPAGRGAPARVEEG